MGNSASSRISPGCETPNFWWSKPGERQPFAELMYPAFIVFVAATLARFAAFKLVLQPLSAYAVGAGAKTARRKFCEAAWRACLYATACGVAVSHLFGGEELPFMSDSYLFWKGYPNQEVTAYEQEAIASIYALYIGLYVHQLIFLFLDLVGSDFVALVVHHCITLSIVTGSWWFRFTRVGVFTMVLHDVSDVFLEIAKCFNYTGKHRKNLAIGADISFVCFATTFFYLRLYIFPVRVLWSATKDSCGWVTCREPPDNTFMNCLFTGPVGFFVPCLYVLQFLQVFWGSKIVNVVLTILSGKELEDPREDE